MKVLAGLVCANSVLQAYAISPKAYGYIFDSKYQPTRNIPSISPVTARLLFAQRLGLSQFHSLDDADEGVLKVLNEYGLAQDPALLDDAYGANSQKLLIFVENVEHPEGFSRIQKM